MKITYPCFCIVLLMSIFTFSQCTKHPDKPQTDYLFPETQTGMGTFSCLVNGQAFIPYTAQRGMNPSKAYYGIQNGKYSLTVFSHYYADPISYSIILHVDTLNMTPGTYTLNISPAGLMFGAAYEVTNNGNTTTYNTSTVSSGELHITRLDSNIVSGTFWFDAQDNVTKKIVQIRRGQFDLNY